MRKTGKRCFANPAVWEDKKPVLKRQPPSPNHVEDELCRAPKGLRVCRTLGAKPSLAEPANPPPMLWRKRTAKYWEPSPACQIPPILFSCYVSSPPQKGTVAFWDPNPAWRSTKNKIPGEKKRLRELYIYMYIYIYIYREREQNKTR